VLRTKEWDFAITVLNETDHIQHQVWHVHDPLHHDHDPEEFRKHGHVIKEFWKEVDRDVGRLAAALPPDATFMILSDHGHGPIYRWVHLNNMLAKKGLIRFKRGPLSLLKRAAFALGFTPGNVYRLLLRLGVGGKKKGGGMEGGGGAGKLARRVFLSEDDIDWSRTRAYATGHMGQIDVNLKGREPQARCRSPRFPRSARKSKPPSPKSTTRGVRSSTASFPAKNSSTVKRWRSRATSSS
jgi:predicted AlkP superfamily phosphohydrolase/phosphomutase